MYIEVVFAMATLKGFTLLFILFKLLIVTLMHNQKSIEYWLELAIMIHPLFNSL